MHSHLNPRDLLKGNKNIRSQNDLNENVPSILIYKNPKTENCAGKWINWGIFREWTIERNELLINTKECTNHGHGHSKERKRKKKKNKIKRVSILAKSNRTKMLELHTNSEAAFVIVFKDTKHL